MRVKIVQSKLHAGSIYLKDAKLELDDNLAQQLIKAQIAVQLDPSEALDAAPTGTSMLRVRFTRAEVIEGAVILRDTELEVDAALAEQLIAAQTAVALDQDELVFTPVSEEEPDEE